jgi:hypothetical protein
MNMTCGLPLEENEECDQVEYVEGKFKVKEVILEGLLL